MTVLRCVIIRETAMGFLDNVVKGLGDDAAGGLSDLLKVRAASADWPRSLVRRAWVM